MRTRKFWPIAFREQRYATARKLANSHIDFADRSQVGAHKPTLFMNSTSINYTALFSNHWIDNTALNQIAQLSARNVSQLTRYIWFGFQNPISQYEGLVKGRYNNNYIIIRYLCSFVSTEATVLTLRPITTNCHWEGKSLLYNKM